MAGHSPHQEKPEIVNQIMNQFITGYFFSFLKNIGIQHTSSLSPTEYSFCRLTLLVRFTLKI